jgi:diguanylate cyclase (GGDEF)-like protein
MDDTRARFQFGCVFGADGRLHDSSEFMMGILGARVVVFDSVVAADRPRLLRAITEPHPTGTPFDLRWKDAAGRIRVLSVIVTPVRETTSGSESSPGPTASADGAPPSGFELRVAEVTEARRLAAVLHAHREVLDQIATSAPIATGLDAVARMIEVTSPETTVAVYLRRGEVIELAAAPSAPPRYVAAAASVLVPSGLPVPGTIEPLAGRLAEIASEVGLGFGWWLTVIDEQGGDVGRIVLLAGDKRFLTADERLQCEEAARLISVAAGTAQSVRRARDADVRDPLTGLLNRAALLRAMAPDDFASVPFAGRDGLNATDDVVAVVVDVDGVATCNRELGFEAGDTMLLAVAEQLRRVVRTRDLLARWSGSRFVIVGRNRRGHEVAGGFVARLRGAVGGRVMVSGRMVDPEATVRAIRQNPGESASELLQRLERASPEALSADADPR